MSIKVFYDGIKHCEPVSSIDVLHGCTLSARSGLPIVEDTLVKLRNTDLSDLNSEKIFAELKEILLSKFPDSGIIHLGLTFATARLFPELHKLVQTPQDDELHPEGDADVHTLKVLWEASLEKLPENKKLILMLSALCHDFGKTVTTKKLRFRTKEGVEERWDAYGHPEAGVAPTQSMLTRMHVPQGITNEVIKLVRNHHMPSDLFKKRGTIDSKSFIKTLDVDLDLLYRLAKADMKGRKTSTDAAEWFKGEFERPRIVFARHLAKLGLMGNFNQILQDVRKLEVSGEITNLKQAKRYLSMVYPHHQSR